MVTRTTEDADDDFDDGPDAAWGDDEPNVPCPYCGWSIPEDAPRCPYCENYISAEDALSSRKPLLVAVGTIAVLYIVYRWIAG